eukprot:1161923-Pelagomonas_calceolata.AAC.14
MEGKWCVTSHIKEGNEDTYGRGTVCTPPPPTRRGSYSQVAVPAYEGSLAEAKKEPVIKPSREDRKDKRPQSRRLTASLFINPHEIMREKRKCVFRYIRLQGQLSGSTEACN